MSFNGSNLPLGTVDLHRERRRATQPQQVRESCADSGRTYQHRVIEIVRDLDGLSDDEFEACKVSKALR